MKQAILILALMLSCCMFAKSQEITGNPRVLGPGPVIIDSDNLQEVVDGVCVNNLEMKHDGSYLSVDMEMDLKDLQVKGNRAVLLTPILTNGSDSIELPSVGIYSRGRYYHYLRNNGEEMLSGVDEMTYRKSEKPDMVEYHQLISYEEWMNGAELSLLRCDYGCCHNMLAKETGLLGRHLEEFFPILVYAQPHAEAVKSRSLEGSAYIAFPVDKTTIRPDYRNNSTELAKICATIDSVRSDKDITITSVWLKGYASPEGSYKHNTDLAIKRTDAVKTYLQQLYTFDADVISTEYEPEDWDGLRTYVEQSTLEHRTEILDIIDDSTLAPDVKEAKIKKTYPTEYRFLLREVYPALRHTDYRTNYTIRGYSDIDEIEKMLATQPQKLSLNEMYLVAQQYEPGSDEFTEVFETAVRMYPTDETANLNAANAAIRRDDLVAATRYLDKAGDSPEAIYARGALAIRSGDIDTARQYLQQAADAGLLQAAETLDQLNQGRR